LQNHLAGTGQQETTTLRAGGQQHQAGLPEKSTK